MVKSAQYQSFAICFVGVVFGLGTFAHAGLSAPPKSHVQPMPDGRHMLVFVAPGPEANDEGKVAQLPDGREVNLRTTFPASGYYEIGSATPIWTAAWDDKDSWIVSDDGRFLVRVNRFGDGNYRLRAGGATSWGLKFYDNGEEIKSYDVAELVDFPSLMPYTSADWHHQWYGDDSDYAAIRGREFYFQTSTHESYRFDLATGEIVGQSRLWRTVLRVAASALVIALLTISLLVIRRRTRAKADRPLAFDRSTKDLQSSTQQTRKSYGYSLRSLLMATTLIAVLCLTVPRWPHIVLLAFFVICALLSARWTLRYCGRDWSALSRFRQKFGMGLRLTVTAALWLSLYVLSAGPVLACLDSLGAPEDVRMAAILTVYRPLVWLEDALPEAFTPFEWYFKAWHIN